MTTEYTAHIVDGEISSGSDFLLLCTSAFWSREVLLPPEYFEVDSCYQERYDEAVRKVKEAEEMTFDEALIQIKRINEQIRARNKEAFVEGITTVFQNEKYKRIRKEIEAWEPPTKDYEKLKKFALEQIDMGIEANENYANSIDETKEKLLDDSEDAIRAYISREIMERKEEADKAFRELEKAIEKNKVKNEWFKKLRESLI